MNVFVEVVEVIRRAVVLQLTKSGGGAGCGRIDVIALEELYSTVSS